MKNKISIVIPVYNAENSITRLAENLILELSNNYHLEIILVNDCSSDNSEKVCIDLYKKFSKIIKFYNLARNVGEHNAVMAGLNQVSGEFAVIMDDDFQNPISEVIKLINYALGNEFDVVYTYYEKKQHSIFRNLGSYFNDRVANYMLKKPKDLYLSSFKIIKNNIIQEMIKYDHPYPYIDGLILRITSNIGKIKVDHHKREDGKSGYTLLKLISLWSNMFTNFSILPLRISIITGFIISILSFCFGIWSIIEKMMNPNIPIGYTSLMVFILLLAGIQLMAIGMVGEYLGRLFLSQSKTPQYIINKRYE